MSEQTIERREIDKQEPSLIHDFELERLTWSDREPHKEGEISRDAEKIIRYNGQQFTLRAWNFMDVSHATNKQQEVFQFKIEGQEDETVSGFLSLQEGMHEFEQEVAIYIQRNRPEYKMITSPLPAGIGLALFENMLRYIQYIADTRGKICTDTVERDPRGGITNERWDQMFVPILEKHGYARGLPTKRKGSTSPLATWVKVYRPRV